MRRLFKYLAFFAVIATSCVKSPNNGTLEGHSAVTGEFLEGNRIEITAEEEDVYTLVYEDGAAKPLADFAPICVLDYSKLNYYKDFIEINVAPREAECIGIYNSKGVRCGVIDISSFKPDYSEEPAYSFGLLSDVHLGKTEVFPEEDFKNALDFFESEEVIWTCICGDITQKGKETELKMYKDIVSKREWPVYVTTGNHDCTTSSKGINAQLWTMYTGQPIVHEQTVSMNNKTDHFLFLGMSYYNFETPYLESSLTWLENKLEAYKDERCFVFTHLFFPDRAGNLNYIYPSENWLQGEQLERLEGLCDRYINSIWFSGHSHWKWDLQKFQRRANVHRLYLLSEPFTGWCVHVPSCGFPITSNGATRVGIEEDSEGAIVQVYENHIDIHGINFKDGRYLPVGVYRLED